MVIGDRCSEAVQREFLYAYGSYGEFARAGVKPVESAQGGRG